ncbi:MAG: LEA type 2 family protein [Vicingaceae bacterium]
MRKSLYRPLIFLSFIFALSSCVNYEEVEITDIKSLKLLELNDKELRVESEVKINNPNNFDIKVVDSEFNVKIENKDIGKSSIVSNVNLPSNSSEYHTLVFRSSFKEMKGNALMTLMGITASGNDDIRFEVDGFIVGKALMMKKKVEVKHSGIVPLKLY